MTSANWLLSGWIDVAMVLGWLSLIGLITARVWRAGEPSEPPPREPSPVAKGAGWLAALVALPALIRRRKR